MWMWKRALTIVVAGGFMAAGGLTPSGQQPAGAEIGQGLRVYDTLCTSCHGAGGTGGRAVPLAASRRVRAMSAGDLETVIRMGTSNGMPPFASLPPQDLRNVSVYVRSLSPIEAVVDPSGNPVAGEAFFFGAGQCATCHMVQGRGNPTGPDLSSIGQQMTPAELTTALVEPGATVARGFATVSVRTGDGRIVRGFVRNEGNHVLPLQTLDGALVAIDKRGAAITREAGSTMPALRATPDQQRDLIAYLSGLRGGAPVHAAKDSPSSPISDFDEILKPRPGDWPTYHGRLDGNRHSAHDQITTTNVGQLRMQWVHSLRGFDNEMTPLVLDGIMYVTGPNQVSALDARSGREMWRYSRPRTPDLRGDAARGFNRGVAVLGPRVFFVTDNAHLLALSRNNGALLWEAVLPENVAQPYGGTMAPLAVGNLIIAGVSGGDEGIRGFLAAYHADTGRQAWRFWTVPTRSDPAAATWQGEVDLEKAGGATWLAGTYDAESGTLFWPTGNPYPDTDGSERQGDNLYTNSMLALDVKSGALRWHYQFTPHDLWDWDAQEPPLLVDATFRGAARKLMLQANRNGFFYVLDRTDGRVLLATPFVDKLTWASGIGSDGRPILLPGNTPDEAGVLTCPAIRGATNWMSTSYSPMTRLFYVMAVENCGTYRSTMFGGGRGRGRGAGAAVAPNPAPAAGGRRGGPPAPTTFGLAGGGFNPGGPGGGGAMVLRALDIETGKRVWEVPQVGNSNNYAGTLSTAGGLLFYGQASGEFAAVDAKTGAPLWHFETQETWKSSPMTYVVDGRQYVTIVSGANVLSFALPTATPGNR